MGRANLERAKELFPSTQMGTEGWLNFFRTAEGEAAVGKLLYDIYDEVLAAEERHAGTHKMGRRARRDPVSLDELFGVVLPQQYNDEPLTVALRKILAKSGETQRSFAARVPISESLLSKILSQDFEPGLAMLDDIAEAAGVKPWFFVEWRAGFLGQLVTEMLLERPNLSVTAVKRMRSASRKERP